jgi:hypothetical protein
MTALRSLAILMVATAVVAGCAHSSSSVATDPDKRWVLVSNLRYTEEGTEPAYVWVEEDRIHTTLTTLLFGKRAIIAPLDVVPRYAPPPGGGQISPLQGRREATP